MGNENKYVAIAEEIAKVINIQLAENVPEFKTLFAEYNDAYCELHKAMSSCGGQHTLNKLTVAVRRHLNHAMLREILALIHPQHRNTFFYLNNTFLLDNTEIEGTAQEIKIRFPIENRDACMKFMSCYKKLMGFYEKETIYCAKRLISECYKYYC